MLGVLALLHTLVCLEQCAFCLLVLLSGCFVDSLCVPTVDRTTTEASER